MTQTADKSLSQRHKTRSLMQKTPLKPPSSRSSSSSYMMRLNASDETFCVRSNDENQSKWVLYTFASNDVPSPFLDNTVLEKKRAAAVERKS